MAALELLHQKQPTGKWQVLEVQRLPRGIGAPDLWRIEAGLQLSKEKREKYGPMNELLKIKEGKDAGLDDKEIAAAMFEWTPKEVADAIERLTLIDTFLEYVGEKDKGGYGFIETYRLHEFFEDLQTYVYKPARSAELPRKIWSERLNHSFGLIWAAAMLMKSGGRKGERITHWDFRDIKKVFDDADATELLLNNLSKVRNPKAIKPEDLRDDFRSARELLALKKDRQQPRRLIETALRALQNINQDNPSFHEEAVKDAFQQLELEVMKLKSSLGL
jgi:hypothetical protein